MNKYHTINGVFEGDFYKSSWGDLHRLDGPAIELAEGDKEWYKDGVRHCENGPAIELTNGTKQWWIEGKRHRDNGPAVEWADGDKLWCKNGRYHRLDGPAVEYANEDKQWYIEGICYTEEKFNKEIEKMKNTENLNVAEYHDLVWYTVFGDITPKQLLQTAAASTQSLNEIINNHIDVAKKEGAPLLNDTINVLLDRILNA